MFSCLHSSDVLIKFECLFAWCWYAVYSKVSWLLKTQIRAEFYALIIKGEGKGKPKRDDKTDTLREWDSDRWGGSKNPKIMRTSYVNDPHLRPTASN